jgi:hypothetical protein
MVGHAALSVTLWRPEWALQFLPPPPPALSKLIRGWRWKSSLWEQSSHIGKGLFNSLLCIVNLRPRDAIDCSQVNSTFNYSTLQLFNHSSGPFFLPQLFSWSKFFSG